MAYGADLVELLRLSASYVDRILRGAHPSDLPVQSSTRFELIINLKTAKALGLEVPPTLLARADEAIECRGNQPPNATSPADIGWRRAGYRFWLGGTAR